MEGKKQPGSSSSSSSSFTSELFDSKDSISSSTGIFGSIFAPPSKVLARGSLRSDAFPKKQDSTNETPTAKSEPQEENSKSNEGGHYYNMLSRDTSSFYQEQRVQPPCHLSSSIYYGGQDIYHHPQNTQTNMTATLKKDGTEDDTGTASRGNWWQGGLYY